VWAMLEKRDDLFSRKSFDKTWIALRTEKRIADSGCPPK